VIIPRENQKDLPDIPEYIRNLMKLHFVDHMDEVLRIALERELVALPLTPAGVDIPVQPEADRAH
jgi:ATP-dependent Lon protease